MLVAKIQLDSFDLDLIRSESALGSDLETHNGANEAQMQVLNRHLGELNEAF